MAKHPGGRPVKYTSEYLSKLADKLRAWIKIPENYWLRDFAIECGIGYQRLDEFEKASKEFSEAYYFAKTVQESRIFKGALTKKFDSFMAHNALKNVAGWRDKQEIEHSGELTFEHFKSQKDKYK